MRILRTLEDLAGVALPRPLGLVPTMGGLHEGHRALVARSRSECRSTVLTIFVNPKQFGPGEDFARYPRDEEGDLAKARAWGADAVFLPHLETVYPSGFGTVVSIPSVSSRLLGAFRPGHFDGVLTVVARLFGLFRPDRAYFGWKDAQQLLLIRRMVEDLALPVAVVGVETVREADGLALSSRNRFLTVAERAKAPLLFRVLSEAADRIRAGERPEEAARWAKEALQGEGFSVEYVACEVIEGVRLLSASVRLGSTRLLENLRL